MRIPRSFAALLLAVPACTSPSTPEVGPVSLTIHHGPPATPVLFVAADDTVVLSTTTDANGHAEATMEAGGSVNVYLPNTSVEDSGLVYTFADVDIGDAYVLEQPDPTWDAITVTTTIPTFPGANYYFVFSPCGTTAGATPTLAIELGNCGDTTDFYVTAQEGSTVLAAFLSRDVVIAPSISLTSASYVVPTPIAVSIANVPAEVSPNVAVNVLVGDWNIGYYECPLLSATSCQITAPAVDGAELGVQFGSSDGANRTQGFMGRAPFTGAVGDYGANLMPWAGSMLGDASAATVTWAETETGAVAIDGVIVYTYASDPATPNPYYYARFTSSRHDGPLVRIPPLPAPYDRFNLNADTSIGAHFTVGFGADYAAFRLAPFNSAVDHTLFETFPSAGYAHAGMQWP